MPWLPRRDAANLPWQPAPLPHGSTGACRGDGVLRRALTANPIAIKGAQLLAQLTQGMGPNFLSRFADRSLDCGRFSIDRRVLLESWGGGQ